MANITELGDEIEFEQMYKKALFINNLSSSIYETVSI